MRRSKKCKVEGRMIVVVVDDRVKMRTKKGDTKKKRQKRAD
jgi:hypothetical protein